VATISEICINNLSGAVHFATFRCDFDDMSRPLQIKIELAGLLRLEFIILMYFYYILMSGYWPNIYVLATDIMGRGGSKVSVSVSPQIMR